MTNKRKFSDGDINQQVKLKRFKKSPAAAAGKLSGQAKQGTHTPARKSAGPLALGKKVLKASARWKMKKKYHFKNAKSAPSDSTQNGTFKKKTGDDEDGAKKVGNSEDKSKDGQKAKKRRRKNKKSKQANKNKQSSETVKSDEKQSAEIRTKLSDQDYKKKTDDVDGAKKVGNSEGKDGQNAKKRRNKNKKSKQTDEKLSAEVRTKLSDQDSKQESGNKAWKKKTKKGKNSAPGEKKQSEDKSVLPRKPEDVSANWKAMLTTLQKHSSTKVQKKTNSVDRRGKGALKRSQEVWFEDVDPELVKANDVSSSFIKATDSKSETTSTGFFSDGAEEGPTKAVALDCEMVGIGRDAKKNLLARVSIVNQYGHCLYDKFVKPREDVTDYRTWVSGVRAADLETGEDFLTVQKEVADLLKGRILVGHALQNDMKVLFLDHPKKMVRDTFRYEPFRAMFKSRRPGLKGLVEKILKVVFQKGEHNSVEDAQAVMKLYMLHRKDWEKSLKGLKGKPYMKQKKTGKA